MSITKTILDGIEQFRESFQQEPDYILIKPSLRGLIKEQTGAYDIPDSIGGIRFEYAVHLPQHQVTIMSKDDKAVLKFLELDGDGETLIY